MTDKKKKKITKKVTTTITEEIIDVNEKTLIVSILDRSGSIRKILSDVVGGYNTFLKEQKKLEGEAMMTTVLFDDQYEIVYDNIPLKEVEEIDEDIWSPRGTTALYDAIGKTIAKVKDDVKKMAKKNRPQKILVVIVTDGKENDSIEYTNDSIKKLINEMEEKDWQFLYLAANQDAFDVGTSMGFSGGNTYTFDTTEEGTKDMFYTVSNATMSYRSMSTSDANYDQLSKNLINTEEEDK